MRSEKNLGFAGGNNLGVKVSSGEYLFFINNYTEFPKGTLEGLLELFQTIPNLGIVSPMLCYHEPKIKQHKDVIQYAGSTPVHPLTGRNRTLGEGEENQGQYTQPQPTAYVHGAAMLVPRRVLEEVGPMAEEFFLYYEELDWCARIKRAGYQAFIHPGVKVYHKESVSVGRISPLKTYYLNRNRIYFMRRNKSRVAFALFSWYMLLVAFPKHLLLFTLRREWEHVRALCTALWWNYGWKKTTEVRRSIQFVET